MVSTIKNSISYETFVFGYGAKCKRLEESRIKKTLYDKPCIIMKLKYFWAPHSYYNLGNIYLFKNSNRNTRKRCEIGSKLTIKTLERRHWRHSGLFFVNFEYISFFKKYFLKEKYSAGNLKIFSSIKKHTPFICSIYLSSLICSNEICS